MLYSDLLQTFKRASLILLLLDSQEMRISASAAVRPGATVGHVFLQQASVIVNDESWILIRK